MLNNFVKFALQEGGSIHPLIIPAGGTGLMNPSIFNDDGKIRIVLRHVNYIFYHSEKKLFQHAWGPLTYLHPENDMHLRTENWFLEMNDDLTINKYTKIDMSFGDSQYEPMWEFRGLEDARLFRWDDKLYICGVRRDTTPNGQGRMELCEIQVTADGGVKEVSRFRIPPPNDPNSYCEKNWMPILDMPYHFVKWTNPTEVVKVDPINKTSSTAVLTERSKLLPRDVRGGTQLITRDDGSRMAMTHEVDLFKSEVGRKDGVYYHRFIVWDKDFNIQKCSKEFFLMDGQVEFSIGICKKDNDYLMTFGFQDNAAYVLRVPTQTVEKFIDQNSA